MPTAYVMIEECSETRFIISFLPKLQHMQFGLQHPNFSFDYEGQDSSQIVDSLKNLIIKAEKPQSYKP
jgi:hypothetical protein